MVRVGNHIGLPSKFIDKRIQELLIRYHSEMSIPFIHRIAQLHTEFESIHPFIDGNGRIGRVLNNYLLIREGFPPIIVRNKEKETYYSASVLTMTPIFQTTIRIVELAALESLHKRLAYLDGLEIIPFSSICRNYVKILFHALLNTARRQTTPAFREKGIWKKERSTKTVGIRPYSCTTLIPMKTRDTKSPAADYISWLAKAHWRFQKSAI